jgi:hypothetical protein
MGAIGALYCGFDLGKASSNPSDMDMRLYNKLCRRLSQEVEATA